MKVNEVLDTINIIDDIKTAICLNKGNPIYRKAKYMADTMDFFIDTCSSNNTERWEKWL